MGDFGTMALSMVGGAIGGMFGPFGFYIGSMLGAWAGQELFGPDPLRIETEGPRLEDLRVQTSSYGVPFNWGWGSFRTAGNVIWAAEIEEVSHTEKISTGGDGCGGGGGGSQRITTYTYFVDLAVAICKGPIAAVSRIWADKKLIYNVAIDEELTLEESYPDITGSLGLAMTSFVKNASGIESLRFTLYIGDETQEPDPVMEGHEGVGEVPAHRGMAYIVFDQFPLEEYGNRIPNFEFEVIHTANESLPYMEVSDVPTRVWGNDSFQLSPVDGFLVYETSGIWVRINSIESREIFERDLSSDPGVPSWSGTLKRFDIDEEGRIFTTGDGSDLTHFTILALNPENFAIAENIYGHTMQSTDFSGNGGTCVAVSRNPFKPDLFVGKLLGGIYQLYREMWTDINLQTFTQDISLYHEITGFKVLALVWDNMNGCVWSLWTEINCNSPYTTKLGRTRSAWDYNNPGDFDYWDITADILCGEYLAIDPASNQIIVGTVTGMDGFGDYDGIAFFDMDDPGGGATARILENVVGPYSRSAFHQGPSGGFLYLESGGRYIKKIDIINHEVAETFDTENDPVIVSGIYDPIHHAFYANCQSATPYALVKIFLNRAYDSGESLDTIVSDICQATGLSASDLDVTDLSADTVKGFLINQRSSARNAISPLMSAYFFDSVESAGKINFLKRPQTSTITIPETDLAVHRENEDRPQEITITRAQELEIPRRIDVEYLDKGTDYERGVQKSRRQITESVEARTLTLPIVLDADEAKQISEVHLGVFWFGREDLVFALTRQYIYLDPADTVIVEQGSDSHFIRLEKLALQGGVINVESKRELATLYINDASGIQGEGLGNVVAYAGPVTFYVLDIPALRDTENRAGVYLVGKGFTDHWSGADIFKSEDDGSSWDLFGSLLGAAILGRAMDVLADGPTTIWDRGGSINVRLESDYTLTGDTEANVLNGTNAALLGDEIIQFATVTAEADGTFTLTDLIRGRRGTEWATADHSIGDQFVLLTGASYLTFADLNLNDYGLARTFKGISFGMSFGSATQRTIITSLVTLKPYSPAHIELARDTSFNITLDWIRRTRVGGEWLDDIDVPLGETSENYEIDIFDDYIEETIAGIGTIETTDEAASYSAASQSSDKPFVIYGQGVGTDDEENWPGRNDKKVIRFTIGLDVKNITGIKIYLTDAVDSSAKVKAVVYSDTGGEPDALLQTGDENASLVEGWNLLTFPGSFNLSAGIYWFGMIGYATTDSFLQAPTTIIATAEVRYNVDIYGDGPTDPFGASSSSTSVPPIKILSDYALPARGKIYQLSANIGRGTPGIIFA